MKTFSVIDSRGLLDDIKDVVKLAKDMGLDDNESFFRYCNQILGENFNFTRFEKSRRALN